MFARQKIGAGGNRVYLQVVETVRRSSHDGPRQRVIATLGRIDHKHPEVQRRVVAQLTAALGQVRSTRKPRVPERCQPIADVS